MSELKPCPFCGGEAKFVHIFENPDKCMVSCRECDGGIDAVFANEDEATAAWNRRAQPANEPLTLEQLRDELSHSDRWLWGEDLSGDGESGWYKCEYLSKWANITNYGKTWVAYARQPEGSENDATI